MPQHSADLLLKFKHSRPPGHNILSGQHAGLKIVSSADRGLMDFGAGDGTRTRNPQLGKLMRYHCATPAQEEDEDWIMNVNQ